MSNPSSSWPWYHSSLSRREAEAVLSGKTPGTFLVRDSSSIPGDFVLSVSESGKISHYIINFKGSYYQIGEQTFQEIPSIIEFYRQHFLDTTTLKEPVPKEPENLETVKAMYNFPGNDPEDLPFRKGDILTVIKKEEPHWWRARDSKGKEGMIPEPYVKPVTASSLPTTSTRRPPSDPTGVSASESFRYHTRPPLDIRSDDFNFAVAIMDHVKPYDDTQLTFHRGDYIKIIKKHEDGAWFGEFNNKTGKFPFTYVRPLHPDEMNGL
ncbi:crk-like protein isoform X1 [Actinia tenebrosa]|uniref:Crk-like protein isoform X1 n=1 Tax=Actinia tenebrosa TaxID=6105 RepID=A0A6P8J5J2_ACTTE|nr:crk-like protein isoform X1 [Actinia tenebrosa]